MKTKSVATLVVAVALLVTLAIAAAAQGVLVDAESAASTASTAHTAWGDYIVVAGSYSNDIGQYVSGTIDPSDGRLHTSYYDATSGNLRMTSHNLATGSRFYRTVDQTGDVGQYTSIAVYSSTNSAMEGGHRLL
jgi:hypothetical protein